MPSLVRTFIEHFGQTEGYAAGKEPLLEYVSTFTHQGNEGYLFKDLKGGAVFLSKGEIFGTQIPAQGIYRFHGFATDSSVPLIEPKQAA